MVNPIVQSIMARGCDFCRAAPPVRFLEAAELRGAARRGFTPDLLGETLAQEFPWPVWEAVVTGRPILISHFGVCENCLGHLKAYLQP